MNGEQGSIPEKTEAEEERWAATLKRRRLHYRCFDVSTPEGDFVVEYYGQAMGNEWILVDGEVAGRGRSTWWYAPYFRFRIGTADAILTVRYWPWLTQRWLRLIVSGKIIYSEGSAGHKLSGDELFKVLSDPHTLDGITVTGGLPTSVPVPKNIICEQQPTSVTLTQRWFSWMSVMMVPFCILLDALVIGVYVLLPKGDLSVIAAVLQLPGILLALCVTYFTLARLVNRTVVTMTTGELSIRHGPLPWPRNRSIPIQQVKGFRCRKHSSRNYAGDVWETYSLSAMVEDGQQVELLHKIGSSGAARTLEQKVEGWLVTAQRAPVAETAVSRSASLGLPRSDRSGV